MADRWGPGRPPAPVPAPRGSGRGPDGFLAYSPGVADPAGRHGVRSAARVVRVGHQVAFVAFDEWCTGAIMVPVPCAVLRQALGLRRDELAGARASAVINARALLDHQVLPRAWQPAPPGLVEPPASRFRATGRRW